MSVLSGDSCVLLTGATGLIGGEVLRALLDLGVRKVWTLVRAEEHTTPVGRLLVRMRRSGADLNGTTDFVHAVVGDTRSAELGLPRDDVERIRGAIDFVIHCAGATSFIRDAECVDTNIAGMRNLIDFVRRCERNPMIVYVSTAANSGAVTHACLGEDDGCKPDGDHHNEYTRSKAVAERMLLDSGLPALVVRPSIVLSAGLPDRVFARTILWFVPLLQNFDAVPIDPSSRLDIVPVDFVARSIIALMAARDRRWKCYHLSAGPRGATTCEAFSRYLDDFFRRENPLCLVPPDQWDGHLRRRHVRARHQRRLFGTFRYYLPFINMDIVYDNARLREEIGDDGVMVPGVTEYAGNLLRLITMEEAEAQSLNP
ncbi:MAG: SDR family oxidoreductase [Phycisphaerae bacterium]